MKMTLWSDLHLEFMEPYPIAKTGADVLILSGDICVASHFLKSKDSPYYEKALQYLEFFRECSENYGHVIYVVGNHEHYSGLFEETISILKNILSIYPNIYILDKDYIDINGTRFFGGTLWTSLDRGHPVIMEIARQGMNDYRVVTQKDKTAYHKLRPSATYHEHIITIENFTKMLSEYTGNVIFVGHHAPSFQCREGNRIPHSLDHCYYSDLDQFIIDHTQIKLWTFGHTHVSLDINIGETRLISNAFGYPHEYNKNYNPNIIIEI